MSAVKAIPADKSTRKSTRPSQTLRPLGDRVVIQLDSANTQSPGGIILTNKAQERPRIGTVKAVGPGRVRENGEIQGVKVYPGDRVLINGYSADNLPEEGEHIVVVREADIIGVYE